MDELGSDERVVRDLLDRGAETVIRLPLRSGLDANDVAGEVESALTPEVLLFMPAVERLRITTAAVRSNGCARLVARSVARA